MVTLSGCQNVEDEGAEAGPVARDPVPSASAGASERTASEPAVEAGYPELYTVPPRPQLTYTVEQRRAIVDGLIADRENARYTSQVVRYRAGLSELPPPATPPVAAQPAESLAALGSTAAAPAPAMVPSEQQVFEAETEVIYDDDDLGSFMEDMRQDTAPPPAEEAAPKPEARAAPGLSSVAVKMAAPIGVPPGVAVIPAAMTRKVPEPAEPQAVAALPAAQVVPPTPAPRPPRAVTLPRPRPEIASRGEDAPRQVAGVTQPRAPARPESEGDGAGIDVTDGLVAIDLARPAPEAGAKPLGVIAFGPGSAALPAGTPERLERLLAEAKGQAKGQNAGIKVVAEGPSPTLALDRARAVGLALVRAGVAADQVEVSPVAATSSDRAGLFLASQAMP